MRHAHASLRFRARYARLWLGMGLPQSRHNARVGGRRMPIRQVSAVFACVRSRGAPYACSRSRMARILSPSPRSPSLASSPPSWRCPCAQTGAAGVAVYTRQIRELSIVPGGRDVPGGRRSRGQRDSPRYVVGHAVTAHCMGVAVDVLPQQGRHTGAAPLTCGMWGVMGLKECNDGAWEERGGLRVQCHGAWWLTDG